MKIFLNIVFLILGFFFLIKGADLFVSGASSIAKKLKISPLIIGLTIVSIGTSAPEAAVSVAASLSGSADMSIGNVVGSNIFNTIVVLATAAVIAPVAVKKNSLKTEFPFLILVSFIFLGFLCDDFLGNGINVISRGEAICFLLLMITFIYILILSAKKEISVNSVLEGNEVNEEVVIEDISILKSIIFLIIGAAGIVFGGECVTSTASFIASLLGMSEALIALTIVALGTSLPELVTTVVAAKRGENDIALGNVIGSNIFNIVLILGLAGVINPIYPENNFIIIDVLFMCLIMILLFILSFKGSLTRKHGILFLGMYVIYLTYIILRNYYPALALIN